MDIRATKMLLEAFETLTENEYESMQAAFAIPGIGEFIQYGFEDANSPQELVSELTGLYKYIEDAARRGDASVAREYGIADLGALRKFWEFAKEVKSNPQYFFDIYKQTANPITESISIDRQLEILNTVARRSTGQIQERAIANIKNIVLSR